MSLCKRAGFKCYGMWWVIGWTWVALVWYLSLAAEPIDIDLGTTFNDKIGHAIAYAWLMFWFGNLYVHQRARISYAVSFILMGILLEILQGSLTVTRQYSYGDMLANASGVGIGFLLVLGVFGRAFKKIESLFTHTV